MPRVLVFTPTYDDLLEAETVASVEAMVFDEFDWVISEENRYPGRDMRNVYEQFCRGREMALAEGYDGLLTVEHDMIVPPDALAKLWATDAPVVYGAYQFRHRMFLVNLFRYEGRDRLGMSLSRYPRELEYARQVGAVEVSGTGMGCLLIRREVLERVPFRYEGNAPDMPFARDCTRLGIRQVGRADVVCGHIDRTWTGRTLWPFGEKDLGMMVNVVALQSVTVADDGRAVVMRVGQEYALGQHAAHEAQRAGFVRILTQPGRETATAAGYETATAPADWLPDRLSAIKGIGPRTVEALNAAGIMTFRQLADADADALAAALDGSSVGQVRRWQSDAIGFLG